MASTAINPVQLDPKTFAALVLEDKLETIKTGGYVYAWGKEHPPVLYRCFDSWESVAVSQGVTADPAAGASHAFVTVPAGKRWKLHTAYCTLVADATVINRIPNLYLRVDGVTNTYVGISGLTVTATQTKTQSWMADSQQLTAGTQYGLFMPGLELPAGASFAPVYVNLQAGDDLGTLTYYYQEVDA